MIKINPSILIIIFIFLVGSNLYSQKLTREDVDSKLPRSWTALKTGTPGDALFSNKNKEIIDFRSDGSVTIEHYTEIMGFTTSEVLWGFDETAQKLITTSPTGGLSNSLEFDIIELTDNKLVLSTPEKQTVYVPTEIIVQENEENSNVNTGLNPHTWSGEMHYNIVIMLDKYHKTSKERVPGVITLEKIGEKKIIRKKELGSTVTWTINGESFNTDLTRYNAVCSDLNFNGDISFQNGFMQLEIYEPQYSSYLFTIE